MMEIPLTKGFSALVDEGDYVQLNQYHWHVNSKGNGIWAYAQRTKQIGERRVTVCMHREILNAQPGQHVDHINGNRLDNRRCNIRLCTVSENRMNSAKSPTKCLSSRYKGVNWRKSTGCWAAKIRINKQDIYLGYHKTEMGAAKAYDSAARKMYGKFACVNFPREGEQGCLSRRTNEEKEVGG